MSKPGQASSTPPRSAGAGRALRLVLRALLAVPVLGVLAALGLALRLAAGPVEVTWLVHAVTPLRLGGPAGQAASLEIGRAWAGWDGLRAGLGAPVVLRFEDVGLRRADGTLLDHVDRARIGLAAAPLLRGVLSIERIDASGAKLRLRRDPERGLDLGLLPPGQAGHGSSGPTLRWDALAHVGIGDLQVAVHDLVVGQDWSVRDVEIDGRPAAAFGDGIVGRIDATLALAGWQSRLHGVGVVVRSGPDPGGDVVWHLASDPVVPSEVARVLPLLAPLQALALPVAPTLEVRFANGPGQFMEPVAAVLTARLGAGSMAVGSSRLLVSSGVVRARASLPDGPGDAAVLQVQQADLQLRAVGDLDQAAPTGPLVHARGTLSIDSLAAVRRIRGRIVVEVPQIGFAGLAQYWPLSAATGARRWITGNITEGVATGLHVESTLASDGGWARLAETDRTGGFDAGGLTLWWLRPMPPLLRMAAHLSFQGPDAVLITVSHAVLPVSAGAGAGSPAPALDVTGGSMRITGLTAKEQIGTVTARLSGGLGAFIAELSHPRLHLLSAHPVPFGHPSGQVRDDLTVTLPLDDRVTMDQIRIRESAQLQDVHLGDVAAGRPLEHADLTLAATGDGLTVEGRGEIGQIPAKLRYAMDFRDGPPAQVVEQAHVSGVVTTDALIGEGLDPSRNVAGSGALALDYAAHRDGAAQVSLGLDLAGLAISTPLWSKRAGQPASASAVIGLRRGRLASIERIEASGPNLAISAQADVSQGRAHRIVVAHFAIGRSSGAGRLDLPQPRPAGAPPQPIRIQMQGPVLDLAQATRGVQPAALPARRAHAATTPTGRAGVVPWQADLAFGRVFVGATAVLDGVRAHLEDDGTRIRAARLAVAGPTAIAVRLTPDAGGRDLAASVADGGALLRGLDVTAALSGGAVRLDGHYDDARPGHPLTAVARVGRFVVLDAPLAARIVRDLSVYGWFGAPPTPQLAVDQVVAPFVFSDGIATVSDARAHSAALGVTLRGRVDLDRRTLDLRGTVVPAWAVNRLPGRLPVVGRLFSPEREGGILAATMTLRGPFDDPVVHVNPFSALVPGALRTLLFD